MDDLLKIKQCQCQEMGSNTYNTHHTGLVGNIQYISLRVSIWK